MRKAALSLLFAFVALAVLGQNDFKEGVHYDIVSDKKSESPVVTEFFSLFCGHCFQFEPLIDTLVKALPSGVNFEKSHVDYIPRDNKPVSFGIVKAFIVMGDLGRQKELSEKFFTAIHLGKEPIDTESEIRQIFIESGVSADEFDRRYSSREVVQRAEKMAALWVDRQISSVPTIVVNDKYKINMSALSNMEQLIALTKQLLKKP
ncbi:thiol:disulfide interchange protein DsbA/DsbL [Roseivirga sp. UBA1976]|uniref:thiol:disulfide interchange protein DsbA/DsbL n=1 Tax=Roseivirga sp. UBA1976 TaxID=1947386 RepID=UPI00257BDEB2|nr:thiol:disulfide interchange protein DsbA/DsbL [Roseivirga sp. UBA1976]MEC7753582.1 thiol:disulfide interchange protein DsbA/DsbL [Bacteroidota bacterium]|tara:strand:+ start:11635 stop:12249 length:615 start_codon:yes stop_codon:yes gene_type:complete